MTELHNESYLLIMESSPEVKAQQSRLVAERWRAGEIDLDGECSLLDIDGPGRPDRPQLVRPQEVPKRNISTVEGHAALVHAIVHIEFNAINLAWDAIYRFRQMPRTYYDDWVNVADEEAYHFQLLRQRLQEIGFDYGDFSAHDGLWDMARRTAHDVMERMALVPRVMEARGLDVTPRIVRRLRSIGDDATATILEDIIFRDEIGHVKIGTYWFRYCCEQRELDPNVVFIKLIGQYINGQLRGPLDDTARRQAGFSAKELHDLHALIE